MYNYNNLISKELIESLKENKTIAISGLSAPSKPLIASLLCRQINLPALLLTSDALRAETIAESIDIFSEGKLNTVLLTSEDAEDDDTSLTLSAEKILKKENFLLVADLLSVSRKVTDPNSLLKSSLVLKKDMQISAEQISRTLLEKGFSRTDMVEKRKEFSIRGFIFDIYPLTHEPVRIEFFGDNIDSIRIFDIESQRSKASVDTVNIVSMGDIEAVSTILDYFGSNSTFIIDEPSGLELSALEREPFVCWEELAVKISEKRTITLSSWGEEERFNFQTHAVTGFNRNLESFLEFMEKHQGLKTIIYSNQSSRLKTILKQHDVSSDIINKTLPEGFIINGELCIITDKELFGSAKVSKKTTKKEVPLKLEDLMPEDYIVHSTHGIGLYHGLITKVIDKTEREFLHIEYAKGDKLYLPVDQIYLIQKMAQAEETKPSLSRMGGKEWKNTKAKIKEEVEKIAKQLLELYAKRESSQGYAFSPDTHWQREMEESFPYHETEDQLKAIESAKADMELSKPMERLICGDAGYGKTEIALRCAFKAVMDGKQVAMLAPTTLLAEQHYNNFSERFAPFPVKVGLMSRFKSQSEQKDTALKISTGEVDIIIGTHRILSKDIKFKDLGLLIIDEEQHFGVIHKEKLKEMSVGVDTILLSATPIPRTLYLTMSGIRDLSVISTPPYNRRPIKTYIFPFQNAIIKGAIIREKERGGQVFFLHNRVSGIESVAKNIANLIPGIRVATAHGQMPEEKLENTIKDFLDGEYDVLACTTIIQSGIDMPNVNTIIVNNAYGFGLAQLYQIRGRVGRSHHQAYAYLLYPPHRVLTDSAKYRMEILKDFTELGSGFHVAMKDLELRGAGDILGKSQHGFIKTVGFELYCQMLSEAVAELKGETIIKDIGAPVIELPISAYIPDTYISDQSQKLTMYRRIASISCDSEIIDLKEEFKDRYGKLPEELYNLLDIAKIKIMLMELLIPKLSWQGKDLFMLMPFFKGLSKNNYKKMRETQIPFEIENNRMTLYGILEDEYWLELFTEFLEKFIKLQSHNDTIYRVD